MKYLVRRLALLSIVFSCTVAGAEEVDLHVRMNNLDMQSPGPTQRLVGIAIFNEAVFESEGGVKRVFFTISHVDGETSTIVFQGEASIAPNQTSVISGNNNVGRIELTYDSTLNRVEARVSYNTQIFNLYRVSILSGSYSGSAEIRSTIAL
jgi:hypothetical protein